MFRDFWFYRRTYVPAPFTRFRDRKARGLQARQAFLVFTNSQAFLPDMRVTRALSVFGQVTTLDLLIVLTFA
jgi:hypothetical protein